MSSIDRCGIARLMLVAAMLTGCASGPHDAVDAKLADAPTPLDQYAPIVTHAPEILALSVHPAGVSPNQRAALALYAAKWRDNGGAQPIVVQAPLNGRTQGDPRAAAAAVANLLGALGVPPARLTVSAYDAAGAASAPVILRYELFVATGADCASRWDNLVATNANAPSRHFGCVQAANLAVEVADAHDLVAPAATAPADNLRRKVVLDSYRQGQITSSVKDSQATVALSTAVN